MSQARTNEDRYNAATNSDGYSESILKDSSWRSKDKKDKTNVFHCKYYNTYFNVLSRFCYITFNVAKQKTKSEHFHFSLAAAGPKARRCKRVTGAVSVTISKRLANH